MMMTSFAWYYFSKLRRFLRISPLFGKFPILLNRAVSGENDGPLQKNRIHQSPTDQTTALSARLNYGTNFGDDRVRNSLLVGDFLLEYSIYLHIYVPFLFSHHRISSQ